MTSIKQSGKLISRMLLISYIIINNNSQTRESHYAKKEFLSNHITSDDGLSRERSFAVICGAHGRYNYNILTRRYTLPKRLNYGPGFGSASLGETAVTEIPQPLIRRKCLDIPMWVAAKTKAMFVNHDFFTAIKHGTGLRDTFEHSYTLTHGEQDDENMSWLRKRVDPHSFEFYQRMSRG